MKLPPFLFEYVPGAIRFVGTRIALEHVLEDYLDGMTPEEIHDEFDHIPLETINEAISYYHREREEVDRYLAISRAEEAAFEAAHPPSAPVLRIRKELTERNSRAKANP
jgi:uncharacterized protein (DUF433 family)